MNIFDFITQEELEDLPDDPHLAFTTFVGHAQRRLSERASELDGGSDQETYYHLEEARHGFMNVVIAAAKRYKVEPFASMDVPTYKQFDHETHRQFKADLDHYMTQLLLNNVVRERSNSVPLTLKAKDRIRGHIHGLKTCLDNADLPDAKRAVLIKKLSEFEAELDRKRLSLLAVTRITLEILALPGGVWASGEIVAKLTNNVLQEVAEAKAADDEARQLPPTRKPMQLSAPRREVPATNYDDLDDDIPF
ncbi:hypothetical protein [Stakelama saccharophila]|uniref:Uncharacterized protein n=1 Tax=Stakelama saccharophila TaxID=3075605 RepID=A0ABZ0B7A9_9SPHN|nr:hypothetical protein [Stakelama sp. W311]WNO53179.1 hypothetical protein RPR59_12090 [Stakelama sp. W311]